MKLWTTSLLALFLAACAASSPEGTYEVTVRRTSGNCPDVPAPQTIQVDASNTLRFAGITGGCPLEEANGRYQGKCEFTSPSQNGSVLWSLDFDGDTVTGTTHDVYTGTVTCVGDYAINGRRK